MRLNLDTGSGKASWEAEGDEQQVADAVAALGAAALDRKKPDVPGEAEVAAVAAALEATLDDKSEEQPEAQPKEQQQGQQLEEADEEEAEEAAAFDSDGEQASAAEAEGQQGEKEGEQQEADEEGTEEEDAEAVGRKFTEKVGACDNKGQFGCLTRQADMVSVLRCGGVWVGRMHACKSLASSQRFPARQHRQRVLPAAVNAAGRRAGRHPLLPCGRPCCPTPAAAASVAGPWRRHWGSRAASASSASLTSILSASRSVPPPASSSEWRDPLRPGTAAAIPALPCPGASSLQQSSGCCPACH